MSVALTIFPSISVCCSFRRTASVDSGEGCAPFSFPGRLSSDAICHLRTRVLNSQQHAQEPRSRDSMSQSSWKLRPATEADISHILGLIKELALCVHHGKTGLTTNCQLTRCTLCRLFVATKRLLSESRRLRSLSVRRCTAPALTLRSCWPSTARRPSEWRSLCVASPLLLRSPSPYPCERAHARTSPYALLAMQFHNYSTWLGKPGIYLEGTLRNIRTVKYTKLTTHSHPQPQTSTSRNRSAARASERPCSATSASSRRSGTADVSSGLSSG